MNIDLSHHRYKKDDNYHSFPPLNTKVYIQNCSEHHKAIDTAVQFSETVNLSGNDRHKIPSLNKKKMNIVLAGKENKVKFDELGIKGCSDYVPIHNLGDVGYAKEFGCRFDVALDEIHENFNVGQNGVEKLLQELNAEVSKLVSRYMPTTMVRMTQQMRRIGYCPSQSMNPVFALSPSMVFYEGYSSSPCQIPWSTGETVLFYVTSPLSHGEKERKDQNYAICLPQVQVWSGGKHFNGLSISLFNGTLIRINTRWLSMGFTLP